MNETESEGTGVWIGHQALSEVEGTPDDAEEFRTFMFEGQYVEDPIVDPDNCVDCWFDMDGISCEVVGDLNGHVAYRKMHGSDRIYTMSWEEWHDRAAEGVIEVDKSLMEEE
jgi:hypothetical protein